MPAVTSFLISLSQWDKQEIEEKLNRRVEFSKRAIGKLLQVSFAMNASLSQLTLLRLHVLPL